MRPLAKIAAVVLAAVVGAAPLTACGNKTDDSFFGRHVPTAAEQAAEAGLFDTYPTFTELTEFTGLTVDASAFAETGLIVVADSNVYDVAGDRMVLTGYENLSVQTAGAYHYFRATSSGKTIYLTPSGETFCGNASETSLPRVEQIPYEGRIRDFLHFTEITESGGSVPRYAVIDGKITAETLSEDEITAGSLPGEGESFVWGEDWEMVSLSDMLALERADSFADNRYVRVETSDGGDGALVFYNAEGKQLSRFVVPADMLAGSQVYAGGRILYQTAAYVDPFATDGYTYLNADGKYTVTSHAFSIDSGRTETLELGYIVTAEQEYIYNYREGRYDAAKISVIEMTDGRAVEGDSRTDTYIVDGEGTVHYKASESFYGMPTVRVGDSFLTDRQYLVDGDLRHIATLPTDITSHIFAFPSVDGIVVSTGGRVGVLGDDGKVRVPFTYTPVFSAYNRPTLPVMEGKVPVYQGLNSYILDLNTGEAKLLGDIVPGARGVPLSGRYIIADTDETLNACFTFDGERVIPDMSRGDIEYIYTAGRVGLKMDTGPRYYKAAW